MIENRNLGLLGLLVLTAAGCGEDAGPNADAGPVRVDAGSGDGGPSDAGPTDGGIDVARRYVLMIRIRQPDGTTNATYLESRESLDPSTVITTRDAREFAAQLRFKTYRSSLYLEDVRLPTLTRFDYDSSTGTLTEGPSITFASRGLQSVRSQFLRPDKAYALDGSGSVIAIFDPTAMTLLPGVIDISSANPPGLSLDLLTVVTRGTRTFLTMAFADLSNPAMPRIEPAIIVAVVDNENDRLIDVLRDERCGHASGSVLADNGDIYIQGNNGFNIIDQTKRACIVRIPAGSETFDDYLWQPAAELGGRESSRLQAVDDTLAVTYALYPERLDPTNPLSIALDPVRRPWILDMATRTATVVEGAPFSKVGIAYEVDGELWFGLSESFEATDIYSVDPDTSSATLEARSEGQVFSITRLP